MADVGNALRRGQRLRGRRERGERLEEGSEGGAIRGRRSGERRGDRCRRRAAEAAAAEEADDAAAASARSHSKELFPERSNGMRVAEKNREKISVPKVYGLRVARSAQTLIAARCAKRTSEGTNGYM